VELTNYNNKEQVLGDDEMTILMAQIMKKQPLMPML
jgi:hypothetical protein